jgi:hypothetical protein
MRAALNTGAFKALVVFAVLATLAQVLEWVVR